MNSKVIIFFAAVVMAVTDGRPSFSYSQLEPHESREDSTEARYEFEWEVSDESSGVDFGQQEARDGDDTQGSHYVLLPDTRFQTVTYFVDGDSGFVADVIYEGEAHFPESTESREYSPRPSYSIPSPTFSAPKSRESFEIPAFTPPRPSYYPQK